MKSNRWHALSVREVFAELKSSEDGLTQREAKLRLLKYGYNELPEGKEPGALELFLVQFFNPLMYIMMLATGVSFALGNKVEGFFILLVLLSNAIVGFYQEYKANSSLHSLKSIIRLKVRVVRNNKEFEIDTQEVVPGDIVVLRAGDKVLSDARIIQCKNLKISEAVLTGEAKPVDKNTSTISEKTEIADRANMVFMGTIVEDGSATVVTVGTGINTEYGDIVSLLKDTPQEPTPLQKMVIGLSKFVGVFITIIVMFIVVGGHLAGHDVRTIFETSLALFVSAIPEGLLPAITIVLVLGMRRILKQKGLVRRLAATETLGGVTVICTDKTGTLTLGKMEATMILTHEGLAKLDVCDPHNLSMAQKMSVHVGMLSTDAYAENPDASFEEIVVRGNLTEQALLRLGARCGLNQYELAQKEPLVDNLLFSSEQKYSASLRRIGEKEMLYVLGAPEVVLSNVSLFLNKKGEEVSTLNSLEFKELLLKKDELVTLGYRVIACAYKNLNHNHVKRDENLENEIHSLVIVGFIAISDPIRNDVPEAFNKTKQAGIRTVIVTGDHALTARYVAGQIGLNIQDENILNGYELEVMSDEDLQEKSKTIMLYARVSPRHKLRIVKALQKNGEVVAMFGDGINDAPALKAADIGVAVDTRISAAQEVADLVLLDGGFNTVIQAIEQGRIIFQNIRKIFLYLITQDFSQFFIFICAILFALPLPVLATQLLMVNLVESGLPDLALTTEQEKEDIMKEPPRSPKESILNKQALRWMISMFAISGSVAFLFYVTILQLKDIETVRTMMMVFLSMESLLLVFSVRSLRKSILRKDIFSNRILLFAVIVSFIMVLSSVYVPGIQNMLHTVSLTGAEWFVIIFINVCEVLTLDHLKLYFFRKNKV